MPRIAADIAEAAIDTILDAEAIGRFESISEADMFDMEYWPPEQAKLGKTARKPLAGQIVAVTGAGGGIGAATARAFAAAGAEVALLDLKLDAATEQAKAIGGARGRSATSPTRRRCSAAFDQVAATFGGLDILVSNAGATPPQGKIGEVDEAVIRAELRAEFLRPPARRAGRREDHAGAGHRRLPAVQRLEAGDQSGAEFRPLRAAPRPRRCSCRANTRSTTAATASAPTR